MKSTKNTRDAIRSTTDLATRLHLSRWTISRVLNGHSGVSEETQTRVRAAMQELGFQPNSLARGLRKGTTNIIGICLPEIEGLYLGQKLEFLRRALAAEGFHAMAAITNGDLQEEAQAFDRFRNLRAAGVVSFASQLTARHPRVRSITEAGIPLVFVDPTIRPPKGSVCVDRSTGMQEAVEYLFSLGHRHITTLGLGPDGHYSRDRMQGISHAYAAHGWEARHFVRQVPLANEGLSHYANGRASAAAVWNANFHPTAVLTVNDRVAIGLMDGLRSLGVRVPEDLSLVGYDAMEVGAFLSPRLTTIDARPDELIAAATERLLQSIRGEDPGAAPEVIPTRLLPRDSAGPAREPEA
ncbi:MAG: LacI family DNA-binding transcriptional regulator [Chthoniobacteraceae bacterium]|nr:LacI family DNA-binding transcriptional regulator [Chthoniobacteraceae bacterium]